MVIADSVNPLQITRDDPWDRARIVIDTSNTSADQSLSELRSMVSSTDETCKGRRPMNAKSRPNPKRKRLRFMMIAACGCCSEWPSGEFRKSAT